MKQIITMLVCAIILAACGSAKSGTAIGQEVCDCYKKANAMEAKDPKRAETQAECLKKQGDAWNKVKDDSKKADEFNKVLSDCSREQIKQSLGQ